MRKSISKRATLIGFSIVGIIVIFLLVNTSFQNKVESNEVYLIVKSDDPEYEFWQKVKSGAEISARELEIDLIFTGPSNEKDIEEQIKIIEKAIEKETFKKI